MLESLKQTSSVLVASPHPSSRRERGESWTGVDAGPRPASYEAEWDHRGGCRWEGSKSAGKEAQGGTYSKVKETVWAVRKRGVGRWLREAAKALRHPSGKAASALDSGATEGRDDRLLAQSSPHLPGLESGLLCFQAQSLPARERLIWCRAGWQGGIPPGLVKEERSRSVQGLSQSPGESALPGLHWSFFSGNKPHTYSACPSRALYLATRGPLRDLHSHCKGSSALRAPQGFFCLSADSLKSFQPSTSKIAIYPRAMRDSAASQSRLTIYIWLPMPYFTSRDPFKNLIDFIS